MFDFSTLGPPNRATTDSTEATSAGMGRAGDSAKPDISISRHVSPQTMTAVAARFKRLVFYERQSARRAWPCPTPTRSRSLFACPILHGAGRCGQRRRNHLRALADPESGIVPVGRRRHGRRLPLLLEAIRKGGGPLLKPQTVVLA